MTTEQEKDPLETEQFTEWLENLDNSPRTKIFDYIYNRGKTKDDIAEYKRTKTPKGCLGSCKKERKSFYQGNVVEIKIGRSAYRVYFTLIGDNVVFLLGGDKSRQSNDIKTAYDLAYELENNL